MVGIFIVFTTAVEFIMRGNQYLVTFLLDILNVVFFLELEGFADLIWVREQILDEQRYKQNDEVMARGTYFQN